MATQQLKVTPAQAERLASVMAAAEAAAAELQNVVAWLALGQVPDGSRLTQIDPAGTLTFEVADGD